MDDDFIKRVELSRKVWAISFLDNDAVSYFGTVIKNALSNTSAIGNPAITKFCDALNINESDAWNGYSNPVTDFLYSTSDLASICHFLNVLFALRWVDTVEKRRFGIRVTEGIALSKVPVAITDPENNSCYFVVPSVEPFIFHEVVTPVLSFLPNSLQELLIQSLQKYSAKDFNGALEKLRLCFESFLKYKFGNTKQFKENRRALRGLIPNSHISSTITNIGQHLDSFFNEDVKHPDVQNMQTVEVIEPEEAEFILYQVCSTMRYLDEYLKKTNA